MRAFRRKNWPTRLLFDFVRPKSHKPSEAFRESTIRFVTLAALIFFTMIAATEVRHGIRLNSIIWYGLIYSLAAIILVVLRHGRVQLAAHCMVLAVVLILIDPSKAYWSPGTIIFSLMFTLVFEMILDNERDASIAVALNMGIYGCIVFLDPGPSSLNPDDYFSQPATAMLTVFSVHLIVIGVAYYIRRAQQERDRMELLVEQHKVDILRQFVGHTSHDLRTALSKISLQLYTIKRRLPSANELQLRALEQSVEQLQKMLLEMLEMAQLDDIAEFNPTEVDLGKLVTEIIERCRPAIQQ